MRLIFLTFGNRFTRIFLEQKKILRRVAMLNRRNDQIMQTNLPVIPNQRWVQQNFMAKV